MSDNLPIPLPTWLIKFSSNDEAWEAWLRSQAVEIEQIRIQASAAFHLEANDPERFEMVKRYGLFNVLRQMALGNVLPELFLRFREQRELLKRLAGLPLADQMAILHDKKRVEYWVMLPSGKRDRKCVNFDSVDRAIYEQVFEITPVGVRIRSDAEMSTWLDTKIAKKPAFKMPPSKLYDVDSVKKYVDIKRLGKYDYATVKGWLKEMEGGEE